MDFKVGQKNYSKGFTLIELLVALGIVAALSVVVVVTLNPLELLRQSRDSTRISDASTLNTALNLYAVENSGSYGAASTTYVSLVDSTTTCANLGLPSLPAGYSYNCVTSTANLKKTDGTGWIPLNLGTITFGNPLSSLPVDPINTTTTGLYYTYNVPGTTWQLELTSVLESQKYASTMTTDGGVSDSAYEVGSNLNLIPASVLNRASSTYGGSPGGSNPAPTLVAISPTSTTAGATSFTLTVNGTGFTASSTVDWNGSARATTFVTSTQLTAAILSADVVASGTIPITVTTPAPGGGTSGSQTFTVNSGYVSGSWATDAAGSGTQSNGNSIAEVNGIFYVVNGYTSQFQKYDPVAKSWTNLATLPGFGSDNGTALARYDSDTIFVLEGASQTVFWKYTISSNTWSVMAPVPWGVNGGSSLVYPGSGDLIYAFAGGTSYFWQYSVSNNSWGNSGAAYGQSNGNSIAEVNGVFYVVAGYTDKFQKYNPSTNSWTNLATLPGFGSDNGTALARYDNNTIFALEGASQTAFWKYTISSSTWSVMATAPGAVNGGGSLAYPGSGDYVYAFAGGGTSNFWKYSINGNSWAAATSTPPAAVGSGGALTAYDADTLYAFRGGDTTSFWKYTISTGLWTAKASSTAVVGDGGSLTSDGSYVYATRGKGTSDFYRYNPGTDSWSSLNSPGFVMGAADTNTKGGIVYSSSLNAIYAVPGTYNGYSGSIFKYSLSSGNWVTGLAYTPATIGNGGALTALDSNTIYALRGGDTTFWKYTISPPGWTTMSPVPATVGNGGALTSDGINVYATVGRGLTSFYKYSPGSDTWSAQASTTIGMGANNANTQGGLTYSSSLNAIYAVPGTGNSIMKNSSL